jgi:hypothetical protein
MGKIGQVKQLIHEVNRLLHDFSKAYFEQIKIKNLTCLKPFGTCQLRIFTLITEVIFIFLGN